MTHAMAWFQSVGSACVMWTVASRRITLLFEVLCHVVWAHKRGSSCHRKTPPSHTSPTPSVMRLGSDAGASGLRIMARRSTRRGVPHSGDSSANVRTQVQRNTVGRIDRKSVV